MSNITENGTLVFPSEQKVLIVAANAEYINNRLSHFIRLFQANGWSVDAACTDAGAVKNVDNSYEVSFSKSIYGGSNREAYKQLKKVIDDSHYDLIQCQNTVSASICRLAARDARKNGTKVIYALFSGFNFQKGLSVTGWQTFYPIEKCLSQFTDTIVATTQEDYLAVKERNFSNCSCMRMHGSGIDTNRFVPVSPEKKASLRLKLGIGAHERVLLCTNDWEEKHNQKMLIHGLATAEERDHRLRLYYLGDGPRKEKLQEFVASKRLDPWVHFPGHCENVEEWLQASDVVLSSSERVGHASSLLEAMACGIPVVASKVRGHVDIIVNHCSGVLFELDDVKGLAHGIFSALGNYREMGEKAREMAMLFSQENVTREMAQVYECVSGKAFTKGITAKTDAEPDFLSVQYAIR